MSILNSEQLAKVKTLTAGMTPGPWFVVWTDDTCSMNAVYVGTKDRGLDHDNQIGMDGSRFGEVVAITLLQEPRLACHDSESWDANAELIAAAPDLLDTINANVKRLHALTTTSEKLLAAIDHGAWADILHEGCNLLQAITQEGHPG